MQKSRIQIQSLFPALLPGIAAAMILFLLTFSVPVSARETARISTAGSADTAAVLVRNVESPEIRSDEASDPPEASGEISEAPEQPVPPGQGQAEYVTELALGQVGYVPDTPNITPYHEIVGASQGQDWCGYFVEWLMRSAGRDDLVPNAPGLASSWEGTHLQGDGYIPRPGDVITFDHNGNGFIDHVGIVISCEDGEVTTVEGNTNVDGYSTYGVARKVHDTWFGVRESGLS